MSTKSPRNDNAGRNRKITKFALAGVAVLGVGAALTSAAWTDNVFFAADASSGNIDLKGSVSGAAGPWLDSDDSGAITLVVPSTVFDGLTPNDSVSVTLHLLNDGDGELQLSAPVVDEGDLLFTTPGSGGSLATATAVGYQEVDNSDDGLIQPGAQATFDLTITTPNWGQSVGMDLDGWVTVQIQATA